MKEFTSAAKRAVEPDNEMKFKLDDQEIVSLRPGEGQIVMLMSAEASETRSEASKMAGMVDFSLMLFDGPSRRYLGRRLIDPEDGFDFDQLMEMVQWCIAEWSDRPTKPSSDSTSLSENGGQSSTDDASAKELTSSGSTQQTPAT